MEDAVALADGARRAPGRRRRRRSPPTRPPPGPGRERSRTRRGPASSWWEHFGRYHDHLRAVAVRLPLLHPQHHRRREARPGATPDFVAASHERWRPRTVPSRWQPARGRPSPARRPCGRRCDDDAVTGRPGRCPRPRSAGAGAAPGARGSTAPGCEEPAWPPRETTLAHGRGRQPALVAVARRHRADPYPALRGGRLRTACPPAGRGRPTATTRPTSCRTAVLVGATPTWSRPRSRTHGDVSRPRARCSRPAASPWSAPPATRPSSARHGPLAVRPSPATVVGVNARDSTRPAGGLYPSVAAAAEPDGPVDLAVLCVPAPPVRRGAGRGRRRRLLGRRWSAAAASPRPAAPGPGYQARAGGGRRAGPASGCSGRTPPGSSPRAARLARQLRARRGRRSGRPGRRGRGQRRGQPRARVPARRGRATASASRSGSATPSTSRAADVLDHLVDDPDTTRRRPARRVGRRRPAPGWRRCAALTAHARSSRWSSAAHDVGDFAASHTGALATSWRTTRAALAQAGAVLVDDERELVDAVGRAVAESPARRPPSRGSAWSPRRPGRACCVLDDLRGRRCRRARADRSAPGTRLGDAAAAADLPAQPGRHRPARDPGSARCSPRSAADPGVDLVAVYALAEPDAVDLAWRCAPSPDPAPDLRGRRPAASRPRPSPSADKLLAAASRSPTGQPGWPPGSRALVADARARHRLPRRRRRTLPPSARPSTSPGAPAGTRTRPRRCSTRSASQPPRAVRATDRGRREASSPSSPGPVAVKLLDAAVLHKTEIGGVHLGVRTAAELDAALDALEAIGATRVLVERWPRRAST